MEMTIRYRGVRNKNRYNPSIHPSLFSHRNAHLHTHYSLYYYLIPNSLFYCYPSYSASSPPLPTPTSSLLYTALCLLCSKLHTALFHLDTSKSHLFDKKLLFYSVCNNFLQTICYLIFYLLKCLSYKNASFIDLYYSGNCYHLWFMFSRV
jgi:hypothetical protein